MQSPAGSLRSHSVAPLVEYRSADEQIAAAALMEMLRLDDSNPGRRKVLKELGPTIQAIKEKVEAWQNEAEKTMAAGRLLLQGKNLGSICEKLNMDRSELELLLTIYDPKTEMVRLVTGHQITLPMLFSAFVLAENINDAARAMSFPIQAAEALHQLVLAPPVAPTVKPRTK